MNEIIRYMLSADVILKIDEYEKATFGKKATKLWDRIIKVLPHGEQIEILGVQATNRDTTIAILYKVDGVEGGKNLPIADEGSLGNLLFMHCVAFATPYQILHTLYSFDYIYAIANIISGRIKPGDSDTYPQYVKRIRPEDFDDEVSLDVFRFELIGENRTDDFVTYLKAIVRYHAQMSTDDMSNNHNELYPVLMYGNRVAFGTYIPFPARILAPYHDSTILPEPEELGLLFSDAVNVISEQRHHLQH
ncbi:hypothetical protein CR5_063 [Cronobacter phage CR5]|uniref:hypothetical protein n=1 Tax=Cronobacter phage CR5 TaxID=1195085 RepID=UPI00034287BF|nr:hypothetical protein CR5_063 [Cronobacter phage CR5]ECF3006316.1 hypothetical protein [Salmonella enterica subsp. enterica serovar Enteritidis]ECG1798668.1 hypothetical protein [Salmonella enterica subsp. enterica serovar Paratyphi B]EIP7032239.1 hypothetical protein [Salmonella enterica]AFO71283.1 hypothetical protein CR5_063 [Cronobacter phage CR5]ECQ9027283.1 hypothetical protein [Salmonella enterica subsp. enterica serovar Enteritidis]